MANNNEQDKLEERVRELQIRKPKDLNEALQMIKLYDQVIEEYKKLPYHPKKELRVGWC